jgi:hypothetical protein
MTQNAPNPYSIHTYMSGADPGFQVKGGALKNCLMFIESSTVLVFVKYFNPYKQECILYYIRP